MRALVFLALLGSALAVPKNVNRIVGGSDTTIEEYPYMTSMEYGWFGIWWYQACGGSLITVNTVLSAAHCYEGDFPSEWRVRLGSTTPSSGGTVYQVSVLKNHENYNGNTIDNDIALVRLSTNAVLSNSVATAPVGGFVPADNAVVTAIGYGTLWSGGPTPSVLQHVDINVINQELCAERYAHLKAQPGFSGWPDITANMLCAGILDVGGKDACQGDSGGPLAYSGNIIVGVTSWGYGCADAFYPGVNTRISQYIDWITQNAV